MSPKSSRTQNTAFYESLFSGTRVLYAHRQTDRYEENNRSVIANSVATEQKIQLLHSR
jgi:hypothetical protein